GAPPPGEVLLELRHRAIRDGVGTLLEPVVRQRPALLDGEAADRGAVAAPLDAGERARHAAGGDGGGGTCGHGTSVILRPEAHSRESDIAGRPRRRPAGEEAT